MKLADRAYQHVKAMLIDGRLRASDWLPVDAIASELRSSRQPVMDAIKRLGIEGFVEVVPQVGSRVLKPEPQDIDDFYRLFAAGEGLIAELCAARAVPGDIAELRLIANQIGALTLVQKSDQGRSESYRVLNRRLHSEMRRISRSTQLADVVESLGDRSDFYVALTRPEMFGLNIERAHTEHQSIIEAIARGDQEGARDAMIAHIFATERRVLEPGKKPEKRVSRKPSPKEQPAKGAAPRVGVTRRTKGAPSQPATVRPK